MEDLFQKFKKQFRSEILGLLEQLEKDLLALENKPGNRDLIDSVFRAMHTIKGTSGMYGLTHMSDFTHHLENIFQSIRDAETSVNRGIIDTALVSLDHIRNLLDDEQLQTTENRKNQDKLLKQISETENAVTQGAEDNHNKTGIEKTSGEHHFRTWYILVRTDEQIFYRGINLVNLLTDLAALGTFRLHRVPALSDSNTETWGIIFISKAGIEEIKDIFLFIEDNCSFSLIKEGDLLNSGNDNFSAEKKTVPAVSDSENSPKDTIAQPDTTNIDVPAEAVQTEKSELKTSLLLSNSQRFDIKRINVDSSKLDYLMYLVSELITLNTRLLQTTKDESCEIVRPQIEEMERLVKLFRNNALEIRLVALNDLVLKFQRLVRDLSRQLGKQIEFITHGTDIELDKSTIDLIAEPLIHIIRNCIDHGIESPEERIKKGKPEAGTIQLSATHVGNYIQLKIEDDGKGLDLVKIKENAIKRGIIKSTDNLSKKELTELIFSSGLSTAQNITSVSGRGVGMDVVKKTLTELHGEISVETTDGKGTAFILKIQQSVAIIDTLLFRVEKSYFIVPLTDIEICLQHKSADILRNRNTDTIEYNNQMIPYINIRKLYNLKGTYPESVKTIIIKSSGKYLALLADEITGEQQSVLKPIGNTFGDKTGIIAVSQYGNGGWAYMMNINLLFEKLKTGNLTRLNPA